MTTVAVTGASGFIGTHACAALRERGNTVVAVVRRPSAAPAQTRPREVPGLDAMALEEAFRGCDAVVHLAARVHVMRETSADPLAAFRHVNVQGALSAYHAACAAGVRRFVLLSSVKVHGEGRDAAYRDSDAPAPSDAYGTSKLEAETRLAAARRAGGSAELVVLRPPLVYGPGVGGNFRRLLRLAEAARRWPLPIGGIRNRRSLVAVQNLVDVIQFVIVTPAARDRTLLVSDGEDLSTSDLLARLALKLGGRARLLPCPAGALRLVARATGRGAELERLVGSLTVDSTPLRTGLGWRPPLSLDAALAETATWWRAGGAT